jgi:putative transcriptional regulator
MQSKLDILSGIPYVEATGGALETTRLGNRLRVARAERRISQEALAALAGVTRQTISSIENGQYNPSALLAFLLARELGTPVNELFFLEEVRHERPNDRKG